MCSAKITINLLVLHCLNRPLVALTGLPAINVKMSNVTFDIICLQNSLTFEMSRWFEDIFLNADIICTAGWLEVGSYKMILEFEFLNFFVEVFSTPATFVLAASIDTLLVCRGWQLSDRVCRQGGRGACRHDGDHLLLIFPALGELIRFARLQTLCNGGHLLDLATLSSLTSFRHAGGWPQ